MARTFLRQDTQVRNSDLYDDTVAPTEAAFETNPANIETDLNNLRSQVHNVLKDRAGNWWDDLNTPAGGSQRGVNDLNTDLNDLELKRFLCAVQVLTNITVGGTDNFVVLSQASSETPTDVAAVNGGTALGAVVATLPADVGANNLNEVTGANALRPKNLLMIRDATTKDSLTSGGQEIFGLLQAESGTADGDAFNDTDKQAQISFVINNGSDDLAACPAADIQGKVIEYLYAARVTLDGIPEDCNFPNVKFADNVSAVDATRQIGYDGQGTTPVDATVTATLDLEAAGISWIIRDDAEASLFTVLEGSAGGTSEVQINAATDIFNVDAVLNNFLNGSAFDTGSAGTTINVGVTANQIDSGGALTVTAATDLLLDSSGGEIHFDDQYRSGSSWTQAFIPLADSAQEWTDYETAFGGEVSLLNAITQAANTTGITKACANVTTNVNEDVDISLSDANLDAALGDLSGGDFVGDHDVYMNGQLLRSGANAAANNDVYPGTDLDNTADGQLKFEFKLKTGDVICTISRA